MAILMGIDIGQRSEPTGLCVAEAQTWETSGQSAVHHIVRHLERLPIGTPLPEIARRAAEVSAGIENRAGHGPQIYVNATTLARELQEYESTSRAMPTNDTELFRWAPTTNS